MSATPNIGFGQAISLAFSNYFTASGRATRSEYWWFSLFNCLLQLPGIFMPDLALPLLVVSLLTMIPGFMLCLRRLHDINKSGWFLLLAFIPIIGGLVLLVWFCQEGSTEANDFGPPRSETLNG